MSCLETIFNRRSVRRYKSEPISESVLKNILEAGRLAPSADNAQPWHFIVVDNPEIKKEIAKYSRWNNFIDDAAIIIVGCGYSNNEWSSVDVSIALENMVIAAEAQGVGSCWIGDFEEENVKSLLGVPAELKIIALISFGYPAEKPRIPKKKNLHEIVHYNRFGTQISK